jgi:hypothetical protein
MASIWLAFNHFSGRVWKVPERGDDDAVRG